MFDILTDQ